jgi:hypothetical protein
MNEIKLPEANWQSDIEDKKELPKEAQVLLDSILVRYNNHTPGVTATPELIELAKKYFSQGVSMGSQKFDITVYEPEEKSMVGRAFFALVPKWQGGKLKYLSEV